MEPTLVRKSRNGITVVFVHGVLSSIEGAWFSPRGGFWPRLLCDDTLLSDVGVYLFGYRADVFAGNTPSTVAYPVVPGAAIYSGCSVSEA